MTLMGEPVADAAQVLRGAMAAGKTLMPYRDQRGTGMITGGETESQPPWNAGAAMAHLIPHAGLRELENEIRVMLGLAEITRGGSDEATAACLTAVVNLAPGLAGDQQAYVAAKLERWCALAFALPAVHALPQWLVIPMPDGSMPPDCPHCGFASLRVNEALGVVVCIYPNCPAVRGGERQWAQVRNEAGRVSWRWLDGTVQP